MRHAPCLAGLFAVVALPLLAQLPPSRFERAGEVAVPGWYRADINPETRGRMMPDARDVRLIGPDGREVPYLLLSSREGRAPLSATALSAAATPGGWLLEFDLGAGAASHHAFRFEFANRAAVSGCRLEASPDRATWRPLASGDLFRLGEGMGLSRSELAYEPSSERYLRLFWPEAAGYPEVRRAEAVPAPLSPTTLLDAVLAVKNAGELSGGQAYLLSLPGSGLRLRHLRLDVDGAGALSYRLFLAQEGRWEKVSEDTLAAGSEGAWPAILCRLETGSSSYLRLELASGANPPPKLKGAWGAFEADRLVFHASQAGNYRLAYGSVGVAPPVYPRFSPPQPPETLPPLLLGDEQEGPAAGLPAARAAMGSAMPETPFAATWGVATKARPGSVVRLELPPELYAVASGSLQDLRLECGGKQVPYYLFSPPEPALVGEWSGLIPTPSRKAGESEVRLPPIPPRLPLTALELRVASAAFERPYTLTSAGEGERPGVDRASWSAGGTWICPGASALPCRETIGFSLSHSPPSGGELRIVFRDGDNPPLPAVSASLWRRRHQLVYLQPETPVRLMAGASGLASPSYDIVALGDQLLATSFTEAEVDTLPTGVSPGGDKMKLALLGVLLLCGGVLLWILAKTLKKGGAE